MAVGTLFMEPASLISRVSALLQIYPMSRSTSLCKVEVTKSSDVEVTKSMQGRGHRVNARFRSASLCKVEVTKSMRCRGHQVYPS